MNWQDKVGTAQIKTCLKVEVVEGIEIKCGISNLSLQRFTRTRSTEKGWWEKEGDKEEEKEEDKEVEDKEGDKEVMVDSSVGNQVRCWQVTLFRLSSGGQQWPGR